MGFHNGLGLGFHPPQSAVQAMVGHLGFTGQPVVAGLVAFPGAGSFPFTPRAATVTTGQGVPSGAGSFPMTARAVTFGITENAGRANLTFTANAVVTDAANVEFPGVTAFSFTGRTATASNSGAGILDTMGVSASAAYSLRKLLAAYVGSAVNIRRSSDNATQDIGFDGSGNFDTASFSSFIGAGSGFVTKWYDQSGNSRDAVQATTTKQPQLVLSDTPNSKPSLAFQLSTHRSLAFATNVTIAQPLSMAAYVKRTGNFTTYQGIMTDGAAGSLQLAFNGVTGQAFGFAGGTGIVVAASNSAYHRMWMTAGAITGKVTLNVDGTSGTTSGTTDTHGFSASNITIGVTDTVGEELDGNLAEVILFPSSIASTAGTLTSDWSTYYG